MNQKKPITSTAGRIRSTSRRNLSVKRQTPLIENENDPENFQIFFPNNCAKNQTKAKFNILTISLSTSHLAQGVIDINEVRYSLGAEQIQGNAEFVESGNIEQRKFDHARPLAGGGSITIDDEPPQQMNLVVVTSKIDKKNVIVHLIFKDARVDSGAINALDSSLEHQQNLEMLKFLNCNLGAPEIITMRNMLAKYPNITDLYIDRNPFTADNIGLLLDETSSLKYLTLRLCQINDNCVKGIAKELKRVSNSLLLLNLSSNYITDLGCLYITNALRMNRSLTVLNLSNNFLTDQSCEYFRSALAKFELTPNEIKIKRQEHFNRLFLRNKLLKKFNQISDNFDIKSQRVKSPKRRPASSGAKTSSKISDLDREKFVNANMPKLTHPFIVDVEAMDGAIFCHGNFQLAYLNLAYNKVTNSGLKVLHNILSYQVNHMNRIGYVGLVSLVFDGNQIAFDIMYEIIGEIHDFLALKNRVKSK